jgi:hypothetical protein
MHAKHLVLGLVLAGTLAGCATSGPCPCTDCAPIGWFTDHYTGTCAPPAPPPPPPPPPPLPPERRGG